jgi:hypothetical protein
MTQQFDCRLLHRANAPVQQRTNVAPGMNTARGAVERERLAEFLSGALMKPLWHSAQQHHMAVEHSLNTMTLAERIAIEIEMMERAQVMHSFDYDPLI